MLAQKWKKDERELEHNGYWPTSRDKTEAHTRVVGNGASNFLSQCMFSFFKAGISRGRGMCLCAGGENVGGLQGVQL